MSPRQLRLERLRRDGLQRERPGKLPVAEQPRQPNSRHPQTAFALSERFRREVSSHDYKCLGPKAKGTLTISGGLASFPWDASTADDLFARADDALLKAKASGKNRIYIVGHDRAQ